MTASDETQPPRTVSAHPVTYWWYLLVFAPMVASLVTIVSVAVGVVVALDIGADLSTYAPAYFALGLMGLPLVVLYPLAMYRDATAVAERDLAWTPTSRCYTVAALLTIPTLFVAAMPLSAYYLYKRRQHVGRP